MRGARGTHTWSMVWEGLLTEVQSSHQFEVESW